MHVKWSNFWNIKFNFSVFLIMVRYDLKMGCANFQGLLFIIDGEIDEKHALQIYQNNCGPGYNIIIRHIQKITINIW